MRTWITTSIVVLVAIVAGILSASHIIQLGLEALPPEHDWQAYLLPLPIDGALLMASLRLAEAKRQNCKPGFIVWMTLFLGVIGSIAANLAAAPPTLTAQLLAVSAPIALTLSVEILLSGFGRPVKASEIDSEPLSTPRGSEDTGEAIPTPQIPVLRIDDSQGKSASAVNASPKRAKEEAKATSQGISTDEANRLIAQDYVTQGVTPNRAQVRQDHRVGAQRADKIIALVREANTMRQEASADLVA